MRRPHTANSESTTATSKESKNFHTFAMLFCDLLFVFSATDGSVKQKPSWSVLVACALRHLTSSDERAGSIIFDQGDHVELLKFLKLPQGEEDETMVYFTVFLATGKVCPVTFTGYRMCSLTIYALVAHWHGTKDTGHLL